jgi:hypothetical protein
MKSLLESDRDRIILGMGERRARRNLYFGTSAQNLVRGQNPLLAVQMLAQQPRYKGFLAQVLIFGSRYLDRESYLISI